MLSLLAESIFVVNFMLGFIKLMNQCFIISYYITTPFFQIFFFWSVNILPMRLCKFLLLCEKMGDSAVIYFYWHFSPIKWTYANLNLLVNLIKCWYYILLLQTGFYKLYNSLNILIIFIHTVQECSYKLKELYCVLEWYL